MWLTNRIGYRQQYAPVSAFTDPTDLTGLQVWLRAGDDSGTNVTCYNDAGSTLCTNTQDVQEWHDESGNSVDFSESTNKPRWMSSISHANSKPGVEFDSAASEQMTASFSAISSYPISIIVVDGAWSGGTGSNLLCYTQSTPAVNQNIELNMNAGGTHDYIMTTSTTDAPDTTSTVTSATDTAVVSGIWRSATDRQIYFNGTSEGTDATSVSFPSSLAQLGMFSVQSGRANIMEVIVTSTDISAQGTEHADLVNYLKTKYGI